MDETIKIFNEKSNSVVYNGKTYYYELYSGRIRWSYDINSLLSNDNYYKEIINHLGFNKYEIIYYYQNKSKRLFIPVSKEVIEYYTTLDKNKNKDNIMLSNANLNNKVDAFYEFSLEIEVENFRTVFQRSMAFEDLIYIETPENENLKLQMSHFFGEPKNIPELESEKYGSGKRYLYFIVPKSRIDKIIGIKTYRDISSFGQYGGEQLTGKKEEIVLDLHNLDKNIYNIFKEQGLLEIIDL